MRGASGNVGRCVRLLLLAGALAAAACSSNSNTSKPAVNTGNPGAAPASASAAVATPAAAASARVASATPSAAAAGSSPAAAVAQSFSPPGGSAAWSNLASGCHGIALPTGAAAPAASDTGVTTSEIKLGSTFGLTGAGSTYVPIIKTIQDCFTQVNAEGGVYGRKVTLDIKDDQYLAANTPNLTQQLVEQDKVFATVANLGTAPQTAVYDYYNQQKVPQVFIGSGAAKWGADPSGHPWSMGFQPDYYDNGQVYAKYIQQNFKGKKIGILRQNDDFGKDYIDGLKKVLGDKGTADNPIIDEETYETTDADVSGQITNLKSKGADVVVLIAVSKFAGLALRDAAQQGWKPIVVLDDSANDPSLNDLAGGKQNTEGVITDFYYRQFNDPDPSIQSLKDFMAKVDPSTQVANFVTFGYAQGQGILEILKRAGVNPTRASFMQAAESFQNYVIPQLLPGSTLNTSKTNHRPITCITMAVFKDGVSVAQGSAICGGG